MHMCIRRTPQIHLNPWIQDRQYKDIYIQISIYVKPMKYLKSLRYFTPLIYRTRQIYIHRWDLWDTFNIIYDILLYYIHPYIYISIHPYICERAQEETNASIHKSQLHQLHTLIHTIVCLTLDILLGIIKWTPSIFAPTNMNSM